MMKVKQDGLRKDCNEKMNRNRDEAAEEHELQKKNRNGEEMCT